MSCFKRQLARLAPGEQPHRYGHSWRRFDGSRSPPLFVCFFCGLLKHRADDGRWVYFDNTLGGKPEECAGL